MKYAKKFILVVGIVMGMCFTGCGDRPVNDENKTEVEQGGEATPEVEEGKDIEIKTEIVENDYIAYTIPEGWKKSPIQINDNAISVMKSNDEAIDVMVILNQPNIDQMIMEEYKANVETNISAQPGCEIQKLEVQERAVGEIVYLEMKSVVTKELVQSMIDSGVVTQESVDATGGLNVYAQGLNLQEIAAYYIYDNNILMIDGKCTANGNLEEVKTQVNTIIDTIKVK